MRRVVGAAGAFPQEVACQGRKAMTEREWLANTRSKRLARFPGRPPGERMGLLFSVACCRRPGTWLVEERSARAIVLERFADGDSTEEEMGLTSRRASAEAGLGDSSSTSRPGAQATRR